GDGVRAGLDGIDLARAAAERLEGEGARARAAVDDVEAVEPLSEPVEERLLHAIGERPRREPGRRGEPAPLERPTDDTKPRHPPTVAARESIPPAAAWPNATRRHSQLDLHRQPTRAAGLLSLTGGARLK